MYERIYGQNEIRNKFQPRHSYLVCCLLYVLGSSMDSIYSDNPTPNKLPIKSVSLLYQYCRFNDSLHSLDKGSCFSKV